MHRSCRSPASMTCCRWQYRCADARTAKACSICPAGAPCYKQVELALMAHGDLIAARHSALWGDTALRNSSLGVSGSGLSGAGSESEVPRGDGHAQCPHSPRNERSSCALNSPLFANLGMHKSKRTSKEPCTGIHCSRRWRTPPCATALVIIAQLCGLPGTLPLRTVGDAWAHQLC
jgi:hypothetical protein